MASDFFTCRYPKKIPRAREFRGKPTRAEAKAWKLLRNRRLAGLKFRRQHPIGPYIADFYCHEHRLVLEIDGSIHGTPEQIRHDRVRTAYIEAQGVSVVRIPNHRVSRRHLYAAVLGALTPTSARARMPALVSLEMPRSHSRRDIIRQVALGLAALALPAPLAAFRRRATSLLSLGPDEERLAAWATMLRTAGLADCTVPLGRAAVQVGQLAEGTPYEPYTLEAYLKSGGSPLETEPLTISLSHFDCVTLVESCLAVARSAAVDGAPSWERFGREIERVRYRDGIRRTYSSRLHYFSEWISDGQRRGLVRDMGPLLGGIDDTRPLRFMTGHRKSYPALTSDATFREIGDMERSLDSQVRHVIPTAHIPVIADQIETGDVLAFATSIPGLDVTHAAFAYRHPDGRLGVLHAPLSGGVVEVASRELPEYVAAIKGSTGVLVAKPLWA